MANNKRKAILQKLVVACVLTACVCISSGLSVRAAVAEDATYFDLLNGAIFDDDASGRLKYDTLERTGVVNAATTSWLNKDFSYVQYESVQTPDGEKPFSECTTEFSVTYSNITLFDTNSILGVAITSEGVRKDYRVYGELKSGYSALMTLGQGETTPFDSPDKASSGNWRAGTECLGLTEGSKTTITATVTPKIGETDGSISFTINGTEAGTIVYKSATQPTMGLVCSKTTATISDASFKVLGATGWVKPPAPPSYNAFNGEQVNLAFGYTASTNAGYFQAPSSEMARPFGNLPDYKSVTLTDGTKTTPDQVTWEYEATFTNFNYAQGKTQATPENYYGMGLSLITTDGVSLNMRIMYDGRLNVAASNSTLFGLGSYGKNFNLYNFCPKTDSDDCKKEITLKYSVNRKTGEVAYFVNDVQFGTLTYIGKAELSQFGFHTCFGGGAYKDVALRMIDVAQVELPPVYEAFNGKETNEIFHYDAKARTAYLPADKKNYTKAFGNVASYKSLTLSDGTKIKSSEAIWEYEAKISNLTYADGALPYYGIGISLMTSDNASLDMRVMYDGRLYICAVPAASASDFGLSASGSIIDIPGFNPSANPEDSQAKTALKFKVNRATGEIGYYVNGSLYGSVTYNGGKEINRYALHSWWGGGEYTDISLRVLDVVDVEVRDYFNEQYVPTNPNDFPAAAPNLDVKPNPNITYKQSCSSVMGINGISGLLLIVGCQNYIKNKKKKGEK